MSLGKNWHTRGVLACVFVKREVGRKEAGRTVGSTRSLHHPMQKMQLTPSPLCPLPFGHLFFPPEKEGPVVGHAKVHLITSSPPPHPRQQKEEEEKEEKEGTPVFVPLSLLIGASLNFWWVKMLLSAWLSDLAKRATPPPNPPPMCVCFYYDNSFKMQSANKKNPLCGLAHFLVLPT